MTSLHTIIYREPLQSRNLSERYNQNNNAFFWIVDAWDVAILLSLEFNFGSLEFGIWKTGGKMLVTFSTAYTLSTITYYMMRDISDDSIYNHLHYGSQIYTRREKEAESISSIIYIYNTTSLCL